MLVSLQIQNLNNSGEYADVWYRVNGTDVAGSARRFYLPERKSSTEPSHVVGVLNTYLDLDAGDYVEIAGVVSNVLVTLEHFPADGSIPKPAIPAAITKVKYIAPQAYSNIYVTNQGFGQATIEHWANSATDKTYAYVIVG